MAHRTNAARIGRRWMLAGAGGAMGAVLAASAALACTPVMGPIRVCSVTTSTWNGSCTDTSVTPATVGKGPEGHTIKVRGWGLKAKPARYALRMGPNDCHDNQAVLNSPTGTPLNAMTTNKAGELDRDLATAGVQVYKAKLPEVSNTPGEYAWGICAEETYPVLDDTATMHATFRVVVM